MRFYYYKCRPKNHPFPVVAWLIMIFQGMAPWKKSSTSHRALGVLKRRNEIEVIESTGKHGVHVDSLDEFKKKYEIVEEIGFRYPLGYNDFHKWERSVVGLEYDYLQVFGLLLKRMFGFITFNSMGKNFKALICNEVILNFMIHFKIMKDQVKDSDNWDLLMTDALIDKLSKR